jgi:hypothetical protein
MLVTSRRMLWLFAIGLVFPLIVATSELPRQDAGQRSIPVGQLSRPDQVPVVQTAGKGQSQGTILGHKSMMITMGARSLSLVTMALEVLTFALGGTVAQAQTAPGTTGVVVVEQPPASGSTPSPPQYQVVTPTPGTGSTVVVQQPPASGSEPSVPQYQLVIPGPNPAQNTGVGLGQQVGTPGNPATIYPTPGP